MSLLTASQASSAKARAGAARAGAQRRAVWAAAQARPLAASARTTARRGICQGRTWAAPRLERSAHVLEDQVGPRMATMLSAAARRIEPVPPPRRHRWPLLAAGLAIAAGLSATAAYLLKRRSACTAPERTDAAADSTSAVPASPKATSEADGRAYAGNGLSAPVV